MAPPAPKPTVIVKRKRRRPGGRRSSGAWKVAYADFVTAMMAFFLLLWLLNVTTSEQRLGIAQYFSPPHVAPDDNPSGSGGVLGGMTITLPGAMVSPGAPLRLEGPPSAGAEAAGEAPAPAPSPAEDHAKPAEDHARAEAERFATAERQLFEAIGGIPELAHLSRNLVIQHVPEGLRIQLVDAADHSMFPLGSSELTPVAERLMEQVAMVVQRLPNRLSISGHTDATPYAGAKAYGNWELSADRANASRRVLVAYGVEEGRITEVVGRADREHLLPDQPASPRNRRISITLLREAADGANPSQPAAAQRRERQ